MPEYSLLLVDDDQEILDSFTTWFTRRGYHVTAASHPQQASAAVSDSDFDIFVLDAWLPETSGVELIDLLNDRCRKPIVMLSGVNDPAVRNAAIERGVYRYLLKPVSMRHLEEILRKAIAEHADAALASSLSGRAAGPAVDHQKSREITASG